jgi:8-oxo-dGTP diphosphatase
MRKTKHCLAETSPEFEDSVIKVVAGAVFNTNGQVLIARRPSHVHQGEKWEFPGGKIEPGESAQGALTRELFEELGIRAQAFKPLIRIRHCYADRTVFLDVRKVIRYAGDPRGQEGQTLAWTALHELSRFSFADANRAILKALILPDLYLITPEPEHGDTSFLRRLEAALRQGIRLVQWRAPGIEAQSYCELAKAIIRTCHEHGARLLVNGEPQWAVRWKADGVHLNSARLRAVRARPLTQDYLVAVSCHNRAEIARAKGIDADFAVVSPVKPTCSHSEVKPLGWRAFCQLCDNAGMPVYALGGMNAGDLPRAKRYGGQGVAAIRGLWPA